MIITNKTTATLLKLLHPLGSAMTTGGSILPPTLALIVVALTDLVRTPLGIMSLAFSRVCFASFSDTCTLAAGPRAAVSPYPSAHPSRHLLELELVLGGLHRAAEWAGGTAPTPERRAWHGSDTAPDPRWRIKCRMELRPCPAHLQVQQGREGTASREGARQARGARGSRPFSLRQPWQVSPPRRRSPPLPRRSPAAQVSRPLHPGGPRPAGVC